MPAALAIVLLLAAPGLPVEVEGDRELAGFLAARLLAAGHTLAGEGDEGEALRIHVEELDDGRALVAVSDRYGPLAERIVEGRDGGDLRLAAWLVVRGAVERVDPADERLPEAAAPVDVAPPPPPPPPARPRPSRFSLGAMLQAAPDMALSSTTFLPVGAHVEGRYLLVDGVSVAADAGYAAGLSGDSVLHSLPVRVGAEMSRPFDGADGSGPVVAGGARVATTPTWATAGTKGGVGVGAAVGVYGRVLAPLGGQVWGVVEAGVETRLLRQAVLADTGVREEALFAAPLAAGLEVRW